MSPRSWLDLAVETCLFLLLLAPVGVALLRLSGRRPGREDLALALALGYAVQLPLLLLELWTGVPGLVLGACLLALAGLRREWGRLLAGAPWRGLLAVPVLLFALAVWVNAGDFQSAGSEVSFRAGADVSDRALYAMIAREVGRRPPPHTENPVFAGAPLTYSFFPALLALLFERYGGIPLLATFLLPLPALGLAFTGLAADRLLRSLNVASSRTRAAAVLLAVFGGDLSWAVPAPNLSALERTRYLSLFWSQSEWLFFNTWVLAAPIALALLTVSGDWLRERRRGDLVLAALLAGALFETKVFTLLPILGGVVLLAALRRSRAPALLACALAAGILPWLVVTRLSAGDDAGFLAWAPLLSARQVLGFVPGLAALRALPLPLALAGSLAVFLFVGLGLRLVGIVALARAARGDRSGFAGLVALAVALGIAASLALAVRPIWYDNSQFLLLPQLLLFLYAAPLLAQGLARPRLRALAAAAFLVAPLTSLHYVAVKKFPEAFTGPDAWDRKRQPLSAGAVATALWLDEHARGADRLAVPLYDDPADLDGLKPFYVSALSRRTLLASRLAFHLPQAEAARRGNDAIALYATADAGAAAAILTRWNIRWVWENASSPLGFRSPRLRLAFASNEVRLYEFR